MAENLEKLNRQLNYYATAKKNINSAIDKLTEIRNILSAKDKFKLTIVDNIIVDIDNCLNNLSNSKTRVNNAINSIKEEINAPNAGI